MILDSVLYVNLPESTYRCECVEQEIHKIGLSKIAYHHEGVKPDPKTVLPKGFSLELLSHCYNHDRALRALGCAMAHFNAYKRIKHNGWKNTLILEDDAVIDAEHFKVCIEQAPEDADIVYLNRSQWPVKVIADPNNNHLFERVNGQLCTVGYVVKASCIDRLIARCDPFAPRPKPDALSIIDVVLANEMEDLKIYRPMKGAIDQDLTKFGSIIAGVPAVEYQKQKELGLM